MSCRATEFRYQRKKSEGNSSKFPSARGGAKHMPSLLFRSEGKSKWQEIHGRRAHSIRGCVVHRSRVVASPSRDLEPKSEIRTAKRTRAACAATGGRKS